MIRFEVVFNNKKSFLVQSSYPLSPKSIDLAILRLNASPAAQLDMCLGTVRHSISLYHVNSIDDQQRTPHVKFVIKSVCSCDRRSFVQPHTADR